VKYAQQQKGKPRVFHELRKDKHGVESSLWSAWWISRMLRTECAPTSPKMVFHSFRHTFKDVCRECGISKELGDALQGHSEGDASSNYGGEFYPLRPLVEAMQKYEVHGVKLPR
jgi:integrase